LPFCFESPAGIIQTVFPDDAKGAVSKLEKLLADTKRAFPFDPSKPFNVGVEIDLHFVRKPINSAMAVRLAPGDPNAVPVTITEVDARKTYPWTYENLRRHLRKRYSDFKENEKYHKIRKPLESDARYCHLRQLDAKNPKSAKQLFYNPNILGVFDQHYTIVTTAR
jgi:EC042_2821-lke REase